MTKTNQTFYGHGKLLLTGEYAVLDGAKALAIPTKFGQKLTIEISKANKRHIIWDSYDLEGKIWLHYDSNKKKESEETKMLEKILTIIEFLNPSIFSENKYHFTTHLEFDRKWGLGSSSTLLFCLASWAKIDMFLLLEKTFGGSGYDLASAKENFAIMYKKVNNKPTWETIDLAFPFKENLYFAYLGKKKNSREAISHYRKTKSKTDFIDEISNLSIELSKAKTLEEFQGIMIIHEKLLSKRLNTPTLNDTLFKNNKKIIAKSLGGWGGDFILIATDLKFETLKSYLKTKNMEVVLKYEEMIYHPKNI